MTSKRWQQGGWKQYGERVSLPVFLCLVRLQSFHRRPDWQRPCRVEGRGRLGWRMDVLSITTALAGGLRSRRAVVRERWPVRSQHSLTTPDSSSRQEQPRICLCGDSRQNDFFHSGQGPMCWPRKKRLLGAIKIQFCGFPETTQSNRLAGFKSCCWSHPGITLFYFAFIGSEMNKKELYTNQLFCSSEVWNLKMWQLGLMIRSKLLFLQSPQQTFPRGMPQF